MLNVCYKSDFNIMFWLHEKIKSIPEDFILTGNILRSLTSRWAKQY
jgi:hypothetical protein